MTPERGADIQRSVDTQLLAATALPSTEGLFVTNQDPQAKYVVETNPVFTEMVSFLGSEHFTDRLEVDAGADQRRLGDAFYETQLVHDAIFEQTGLRFLQNVDTGERFRDDTAQMQYLMDNGIAASATLELSWGMALSAEQVALLTHDMIWMVEQQIDGPNGPESVLVPVYYASRVNSADLQNGAMLTGGMRRLELIVLHWVSLDYERGTVFIQQGKGKKDRMIPIGERALKWIYKYQYEGRPELTLGQDDGSLFVTHLGEAFSPNGLTALVRKYIQQADIGKSGSCHLFRHTCATLMLENGADVRCFIQAMLGHAKMDTTAIYTQVSIWQLKDIHTMTHPAKAGRRGR